MTPGCQTDSFSVTLHLLSKQTGEYATDEEDTGTTVAGGEKSIEVFDLPETEDILSPSELDANKLYQKFREVNYSTTPYHVVMVIQWTGAYTFCSLSLGCRINCQ